MKTKNIKNLQDSLCHQFCKDIKVSMKNDHLIRIETPFYFPDGDPYQIYLVELETGGFRVTDKGHTLMHLSYENDLDALEKGTRGKLLNQIQLELGLKEEDGEFYLESTLEDIPANIFRLGQGIIKIYDLTYLNRVRVESTFYEDLNSRIYELVNEENIIRNYIYDSKDYAEDYPIDYKIEGKIDPLFGVGNKDKARIVTIVLERLIRHEASFESLIVFQDFDEIPKNDAKRLMNVSGEMITSLDGREDLSRKLLKRVA